MKKIAKKITALALVACMVFPMAGCGKKKEIPTVQISIWSDEANIDLVKEELDAFKKLHKNEVNYEFTISIEGEDTCKATVLANPEAAADIYTFADDQFQELCQNGALLEVTENEDLVMENVGGKDSGAVKAATWNDKLYAYPLTSGNGYFLYYNKEYFTDSDVKTLDQIISVCEKNGKQFTMDFSSGWYLYSFFKGAGLDIYCSEDGKTNVCNWNATDTKYTGLDVVNSMVVLTSSTSFITLGDDGFVEAVQNGTVIAGVNGPWNATKMEEAWGENYGATKLPTYTVAGDQVQMCSFAGYKLIGINAHTEYPKECMEVVEYLTNEENQLKRFEVTGECPANIKAAETEAVQASPAVAALLLQSQFGNVQNVADPYWAASSKLGIVIASGNKDGKDLQQLLDETKEAIVTYGE